MPMMTLLLVGAIVMFALGGSVGMEAPVAGGSAPTTAAISATSLGAEAVISVRSETKSERWQHRGPMMRFGSILALLTAAACRVRPRRGSTVGAEVAVDAIACLPAAHRGAQSATGSRARIALLQSV